VPNDVFLWVRGSSNVYGVWIFLKVVEIDFRVPR